MVGHIRWLVDSRIALVTNIGAQTREIIQQNIIDLNQLIASSNQPVHVISDSRRVTSAPMSIIGVLKDIFTGSKMDNAGHVVIVTKSRIFQFTGRFAAHFSGSTSQSGAKSVTEAIKILQDFDATLPKNIVYDEDNALGLSTG